jgi:hypothetical protein
LFRHFRRVAVRALSWIEWQLHLAQAAKFPAHEKTAIDLS